MRGDKTYPWRIPRRPGSPKIRGGKKHTNLFILFVSVLVSPVPLFSDFWYCHDFVLAGKRAWEKKLLLILTEWDDFSENLPFRLENPLERGRVRKANFLHHKSWQILHFLVTLSFLTLSVICSSLKRYLSPGHIAGNECMDDPNESKKKMPERQKEEKTVKGKEPRDCSQKRLWTL